jgi:uncharacterized membrane protein
MRRGDPGASSLPGLPAQRAGNPVEPNQEDLVATIEQSIDVAVPVRTAYNQWTQFEEFPTFMEGVKEVRQIDDLRTHWVAEIGGKREEWDAEITEQKPDQRVAWRSTSGKETAGVVTFHPLADAETRVTVRIEHGTDGLVESVGSALGVDDRRVKGDLERFRDMIEQRGAETGAWRGQVGHGQLHGSGDETTGSSLN